MQDLCDIADNGLQGDIVDLAEAKPGRQPGPTPGTPAYQVEVEAAPGQWLKGEIVKHEYCLRVTGYRVQTAIRKAEKQYKQHSLRVIDLSTGKEAPGFKQVQGFDKY